MIQIPVEPRVPIIVQPGVGLVTSFQGGVLTVSLVTLTTQVVGAAIAYLQPIASASWSNFITASVGDRDSTDGSYQAVFTTPVAPVNGILWGLLQAYLTSLGRSALQVQLDLVAIWAAAPNVPI